MRNSSTAVVVALAVLLHVPSVTPLAAQQPAPMLACFVPRSGTMYMVGREGAPTTCRAADHVLVQWNVVGAQGAPGPQGAQGPAGPAGSLTGAGAMVGFELVRRTVVIADAPTTFEFVVVTCPVGKVAIAGGLLNQNAFVSVTSGFAVHRLPFFHLVGSYPNSAFGYSDREWVLQLLRLGAAGATVEAVATCVRMS